MGAGRHAAHPGGGSAGAPAESWILQLLAAPRTASEAEGQPRVLVLGPVEVVDAPVAEAEWGAYVRAAVQDEATVSSDWQEFQALYARGIAERGAAGDTALARALALVRGAPFAEVTGPDYAWAEPFRTAIAQQIVDAAHELTLRRLRMGDHRGAEAAAARGLVVAPQAQLLLRDLLCVHADERATAALQRTAARLERLAAQGGARLEAESTALLSELRGGEPAWS